MTLALGVDTGGTYTDAVLIRDERDVIAKAKALTTRHDLAIGVEQAVKSVLFSAGVAAHEIATAALSTTLATNALVEGQGGRVGLIFVGFRESDLATQGLADALQGDPACVIAGGHGHAGDETAPLDEATLRDFLAREGAGVSGFAVASRFATRNPAHELRTMEIVAEVTGLPVSASHHLSSKLGGPKRAVTAVLNARLVGMIDRLIGRAQGKLHELGVTAALMVVRGDGALMSAAEARRRPIETILSGPAASLVGARWLTGARDALVSDIGGTTTDVALLRNGSPAIDPDGAQVGPHRTMVEAVKMRTFGLGGDSEVHMVASGLRGGVVLGPRRVVPVALMATEAPEAVLTALEQQCRQTVPGEHDGRFLRRVSGISTKGLGAREQALLARLGDSVRPLGDVLRNRVEQGALKRLVARGIVQLSAVTPSDAVHALGWLAAWNRDAACLALELFARRRDGAGNKLAQTPEGMADVIVAQMTRQTGLAFLETGFAEEDISESPRVLAEHMLMRMGLAKHTNVVRIDAGLALPVIGLGASAACYYPAVGEMLGTSMSIPEHADVANAIGAVVGRISVKRSGSVTSESEGQYRAHLNCGPSDFSDRDAAISAIVQDLTDHAMVAAQFAGAANVEIEVQKDIREANIEARKVFVQADITVTASGRPRMASKAGVL